MSAFVLVPVLGVTGAAPAHEHTDLDGFYVNMEINAPPPQKGSRSIRNTEGNVICTLKCPRWSSAAAQVHSDASFTVTRSISGPALESQGQGIHCVSKQNPIKLMTSLSKWIVVHVLINSVTGVLDKLSSLQKVMFLPMFLSGRCGTANFIIAPEGEGGGKKNTEEGDFKWEEQHRILNVYHETIYSDWLLDGTLSLDSFVLVTSAFWHRQKNKTKMFFLRWLREKKKTSSSITKN